MAKVLTSRILGISAVVGTDKGKNIVKTQKFSRLKLSVPSENLFNVGKALGELMHKETGTELAITEQEGNVLE